MTEASTINTPQNANQAPMVAPLYYAEIAPLSTSMHKNFKLRPEGDFAFANKSNTVPLTVPEFTLAARHYPILLLTDDLVPTAALGVQPEQNLFLKADGLWEPGVYVPAYIRRHPFILLGGPDDKLTLGIDMAANSSKEGARALFNDDGKETEVIAQVMDLCTQFHQAFLFTRDFSEALKKSDIVIDCTLEVETSPGQRAQLGSFKRIDEEKFKNLPDATVLEWRKTGYLHAVYFLLQSMNNWDILLQKNNPAAMRPAG